MNGKTIKRVFIIFALSFAVIFILRFIYELSYYGNSSFYPARWDVLVQSYGSKEQRSASSINYYDAGISNVATERQMVQGETGIELNYEQKYEMISRISAESDDFDNDVNLFRKAVSDLNGVVQAEDMIGLEQNNNRSLWVTVGITPGKFDLLVEQLKAIGSIVNFSSNKIDKTSEFMSYLAQSEALQKSLESYNSIKAQGGTIADLLKLEEKIIETEREMLQMGVTLGLYDENQSLCTVVFALNELGYNAYGNSIDFSIVLMCISEALIWSIQFYLAALLIIVITAFSALGCAFVWSRITKQQIKKAEPVQVNTDNDEKGAEK